jgi:protoheme IX farnesyltransferase
MSPAAVLAIAVIAGGAGSALLLFGANLMAAALGLLAMASYNALYTPLKRVTPWAALPGSIVGAIPPMLGWAATGRSILDPAILAVAAYFFVWQVPHFWLLLLYFSDDYERSGLPCLTRVLNRSKLARATFAGIVLTALVVGAGIPLAGGAGAIWTVGLLAAASTWLVWAARPLARRTALESRVVLKVFIKINVFALIVIVVLSMGALM